MLGEIRTTLRSLKRAWWYAGTVVCVTALSFALAVPVFAVVDGVLFRSLPYRDPDQLFTITAGFKGDRTLADHMGVSPVDVENWTAAIPGTDFAGYAANPSFALGEHVNEPYYGTARVQRNFFDVVGVQPLIGGFAPQDFEQEQPLRPTIITDELWERRFRRTKTVIGRTIVVDLTRGIGFRIVGVMPRGFAFPAPYANVTSILPFTIDRRSMMDPTYRVIPYVIARAPSGTVSTALRAQLEAGLLSTARAFPIRGERPSDYSERAWRRLGPFDDATVVPLSTTLREPSRRLFAGALLGVLVLVAVAGLNASALIATRALDRLREFVRRRALGASAFAVARLLALESLLLTASGAAIGVLLAWPILRFGLRLLPDQTVLFKRAEFDWRVTAFLVLLVLLQSSLVSVWPIRRALSVGLTSEIVGGRSSSRAKTAAHFVVLASQVAGVLVLTIVGSLLVRSVLSVQEHTFPVPPNGVVIKAHVLSPVNDTATGRAVRLTAIVDRLRAIPGVESAAVTGAELFGGGSSSWPNPNPTASSRRIDVDVQSVTADYYRVAALQLISGRLPSTEELVSDARVIVVSESVARACWPEKSAIGQVLNDREDGIPMTVVGVVRDVRWSGWDVPTASVYGPYVHLARRPFATFLLRTRGGAARVIAAALRTIDATDPLVRPVRAATMEEVLADSIRARRLQSWVFGAFATVALVIVGAGILGTLAMSTVRRAKELAIRQALGSTRSAIVRHLLGEQLRPTLVGLLAGAIVAFWAVRFLKTELHEITVYDLRAWLSSIVLVLAAAIAGSIGPLRAVSRSDFKHVLREE